MKRMKRIAIVAHDNRKQDMKEWVEYNFGTLIRHKLVSTGTTGRLVEEIIRKKMGQDRVSQEPPELIKLKSGPLGGDQQLGAMIVDGRIDCVIFFWDPMEPFPHDVDVKALLRIAVLYNIPIACNRSTADFLISSPLLNEAYEPVVKDYSGYIDRRIP